MNNRSIDLNMFYREDWDAETEETTWSNLLTIDPYIYVEDGRGTRKYETPLLIECTWEETKAIAEHYPEDEYGSDWWDFAENFLAFAPERIASLINTINVNELPAEPNWWIAMAEEISI